MTFTINSIARCTGGNHVFVTATVNGVQRRIDLTRDELSLDDVDQRDLFIARIRSAVKESGATTNAQIQAALVGKEFHI